MNIFLSRPTWVKKEYEEGLENFLKFLKSKDISPRTIGTTDYPSESPLDEVINLMEKCSGVIILGYPQIFIEKGDLKEAPIPDSLNLATEWNHIEASLAYARKLPLLIVHDVGVKRGIFDRGAINNFIYEKDLKKPSWVLDDNISGALETWIEKVESPKNNHGFYQRNPIKSEKEIKLSDDESELIECFLDDSGFIPKHEIKSKIQKSENFLEFILTSLENKSLVKKFFSPGYPVKYKLTQKGKKYLYDKGKLNS